MAGHQAGAALPLIGRLANEKQQGGLMGFGKTSSAGASKDCAHMNDFFCVIMW